MWGGSGGPALSNTSRLPRVPGVGSGDLLPSAVAVSFTPPGTGQSRPVQTEAGPAMDNDPSFVFILVEVVRVR